MGFIMIVCHNTTNKKRHTSIFAYTNSRKLLNISNYVAIIDGNSLRTHGIA